MVRGMRSAVRASWLTLLLAAALAFTLPSAASMAGAAAAAPSPGAHRVWAAAATRPGAVHTAAPARPAQRHVARSARRPDAPAQARPQHTAWDLASVLVHVPAAGLTAHAEASSGSRVV